MAKKKSEESAAVEVKAAPKKAAAKKAPAKKAVAKKEVVVNAENAGFKAGDVYEALAAAGKSLSVKEIAKVAKISEEEVFLGMGWLLKEGKIKDDGELIALT